MHTSYQTWPYQHIAFTSFLGVKAPLELANLASVTKKFQNVLTIVQITCLISGIL